MDNFIVSARKYRPASFDMVVGQDAITQTLKRAILTKHLAQAYLFCGPRGVGKTTCARIFAKTINCTNLSADAEACNECESCMSYNSSRSYNIHELDAASNNKVEDIRNLTDQVRIPPQVGKYSVYIIDEVHMLTTQAFNAFLKTLEEPPAHAIFILATTEKHKIIPTILSRCQIFDFNRIGIDDIVNRLKYVAEKENVSAEEEALHVIAKKADGAMRDALSIFDQVVSLCGKDIKYKDVTSNLNVLDYEYYFKVVDATLRADVSSALLLFDDILSKGFDGYNFLTGLSSHFRDLLVSKDPATTRLLETTQSVRKLYVDQAASCSVPFLYKALDICNKADISYKTTKNQRLYVEMALIRLCSLIGLPPSSQSNEKKKSEQLQQPVKEDKIREENPPVNQVVVKQSVETPKKSEDSPKTIPPQNNQHIPIENMARTAHHSRGISITNMLGGSGNVTPKVSEDDNKEEKRETPNDNKEKKPLNDQTLKEVWSEFVKTQSQESPRVLSMLQTVELKLEGDNLIFVILANASQRDFFVTTYRPKVLSFLIDEFGNPNLNINSVVSENISEEIIYGNEQKVKKMISENPVLKDYIKDLDLDIY